MNVKNIQVQTNGNYAQATINGILANPSYFISDVCVNRNDYCLEVKITTSKKNSGGFTTQVMTPFQETINLGSLTSGKWVVRINGNNDWIKWFNV